MAYGPEVLFIRYDRRYFIISPKLFVHVNRSKKQLEKARAKRFRLIRHIIINTLKLLPYV